MFSKSLKYTVIVLGFVVSFLWAEDQAASSAETSKADSVEMGVQANSESTENTVSVPLAKTELEQPGDEDVIFLSLREFNESFLYPRIAADLIADSVLPASHTRFVKAAAAYSQGKWQEAIDIYTPLIGKFPRINGQIITRVARSWLELGNPQKARETLLSPISIESNKSRWAAVDKLLVLALLEDSSFDDQQTLDSILWRLDKKPDADHRAWLQWQRAKLLDTKGKKDEVAEVLAEVFVQDIPAADSAWKMLQSGKYPLGTDFVLLKTVGLKYCSQGKWNSCEKVLEPLLSRGPSGKTEIEIREALANAWYNSKEYSKAGKQYEVLMDKFSTKSWWVRQAARSYSKAGRKDLSRKYYGEFKRRWPHSNQTASMLWVKAFEFEQDEKWSKARDTYAELGPEFSPNSRRQWAGFRMGFISYKLGEYQRAIKEFQDAVNDSKARLWPRNGAMFLLADSYRLAGNKQKAIQWYIATIDDFPVSWYAWRARQALAEYKLMPKDSIPWIHPQKLSHAETLKWIRSLSSEKNSKSYSQETMDEVEFLLAAGFGEEAEDLYYSTRGPYRKQLDHMYEYGTLFHKYGHLTRSHQLARSFIARIARQNMDEAPFRVMEWLYPQPYFLEIRKWIKSKDLDPWFVLSVIRQESIFDAGISSPVGARGFMQIMPATGDMLAEQEGIKDRFHHDLLFNPYMAIRLGTRYLNDLMDEYGDPRFVLANYNAGPGPARRWQKQFGDAPIDIAAEEISYYETRHYIKKVMANYWTYHSIYDFEVKH